MSEQDRSDQVIDALVTVHQALQGYVSLEKYGAVSDERDAATARLTRLETALSPILAYLTALVVTADNQGHLREGDVRSDKLAMVNDVWLRRSDIAALAATQEEAGAGEPSLAAVCVCGHWGYSHAHAGVNACSAETPDGLLPCPCEEFASAPPAPQRCTDCGRTGHSSCDRMPADGGPRYGFEAPPAPRPGEQEADNRE